MPPRAGRRETIILMIHCRNLMVALALVAAAFVMGGGVASASTVTPKGTERKAGGNVEAAKAVGKLIAERGIEKGIKKVVFDRGGYLYHGRIKALADAAREAGLEF